MRRIHRMPFGAEPGPDGVRFALWAPTTDAATLVADGRNRLLAAEDGGWYRADIAGMGAGTRYAYRVGGGLAVPDPASRFQPEDCHRESVVVDPGAYAWSDGAWRGRPW